MGSPLSKAKYTATTDRAQVPRGKGEKNPGEGSEIESETIRLQAVKGGRKFPDGVPFGE
jgi:hypothetical protein